MNRLPKGYLGTEHETIGSDILAISKVLHLPERALGPELAGQIARVQADQWYPISLLLEALEALDKKLDSYALRSVGWSLFKLSHEADIRANAKSARDICYGIDGMYHRANRGEAIGGWKVLEFKPGHAELEKTTPHHCVMEEGILEEALRTVGVTAKIQQPVCFRKGAPACRFLITSPMTDVRWTG